MRKLLRDKVRPVALTLIAPTIGFLVLLFLEVFMKIEVSKLWSSLVNLMVVGLIAFVVFPRWLGIPFGIMETRGFLKEVGFYFPVSGWKHIVLGLLLAACTLSGMLLASILTGRYTMDVSTIKLPHIVFSLNPALWEELFYRGVLMFLLLGFTRSLKQAFLGQVVLFGVMHIKGADPAALVDSFSVILLGVGFTYVAYKTRTLVAGMVFHYFHDAFLFLVQLPDEAYTRVTDNAVFYGLLWAMVGVGCLITRWFADRFGVRGPVGLYDREDAGVRAEGQAC